MSVVVPTLSNCFDFKQVSICRSDSKGVVANSFSLICLIIYFILGLSKRAIREIHCLALWEETCTLHEQQQILIRAQPGKTFPCEETGKKSRTEATDVTPG